MKVSFPFKIVLLKNTQVLKSNNLFWLKKLPLMEIFKPFKVTCHFYMVKKKKKKNLPRTL